MVKPDGQIFNRYFLPTGGFTESATGIHGHTRESLEKKGAKEFSAKDSDDIKKFIGGLDPNGLSTTLVVAHNYDFDRAVIEDAHRKIKGFMNPWSNACTMSIH